MQFSLCALLAYSLLAVFLGVSGVLTRPCWTDEGHFYRTTLQFLSHLHASPSEFLAHIRSYGELSGPLPFIMFATAAGAFGAQLWKLRLVVLFMSLLTSVGFFALLRRQIEATSAGFPDADFARPRVGHMVLFMAPLLLNPYYWGTSVFLYTDMPAMLFLVWCLYLFVRGRYLPSGLLAGMALWCRQYFIFVPLGMLFWLGVSRSGREHRALVAPFVALVVFLPLLLVWHGLTPTLEGTVFDGLRPSIHPGIVVFNVIVLVVYSLSVLWLRLKRRPDWRTVLLAGILAPVYFMFPPRPLPYPELTPSSMGFFDKFMEAVFKGGKDVPYMLLFAVGSAALVSLLRSGWRSQVGRLYSTLLVAFLAANLYGYLIWEKYSLPALPVVSLLLAADSEAVARVLKLRKPVAQRRAV